MSKPALRYLSLGFLVSALILAGYRSFFYEPQPASAKDTASTELTQVEETYKEKYETLLAETELAKMESEYAVENESSESSESTESKEPAEESQSDESNTKEDEVAATITINEGDPSSIAASQLQEQGIIDDSTEFDRFLEENNLSNLVRPGTFTVDNTMSFQDIANILLSEN